MVFRIGRRCTIGYKDRQTMSKLLIHRAQWFSSVVHEGQKYGPKPYTHHLERVHAVLRRFGVEDEEVLAAGWLHDVLEDTAITYKQLELGFGRRVADIVFDVTDELGRSRAERKDKTYKKTAKNKDAIVVKLADRIANAEQQREYDNHMIEKYRVEWPHMFDELWRFTFEKDVILNAMFQYLDELMTIDERKQK